MQLWLLPADVRDYANLTGTAGRYSDRSLGSNIRTAQTKFQRDTSRQFEVETTTKTFTTNGDAAIAIPDLTSASAVTLQSAPLTANSSYWLHSDAQHSGVYVAIQVRSFGAGGLGYLANPEWFDRNLDRSSGYSSLPNDLAITGTWGWASKPDDVLLGIKAYAAWLTKRADALLAGAAVQGDGTMLDYSQLPVEFTAAVRSYTRGTQATMIG